MSPNRRWVALATCALAVSIVLPVALAAPDPANGPEPRATGQGVRPPDRDDVQTVESILAELDRDPDKIVAEVGPRVVSRRDIAVAIRAMPGYVASLPPAEIYERGTLIALQQKALAVRAVNAGLDRLPTVQQRLRSAAEDALADLYLRGALNANVTDAVLHRAYEQLVAGKPGPEEIRARIIVTDTEAAAEAAIARVKSGINFGAVASADSIDGTAAKGGDLGYVRAGMLAPELEAVLFSLDFGAMTNHPVLSGDHWYVLRVEGRSTREALSFEEARPALERDLALIEIPRIKQDAVSSAKIVFHGGLTQGGDE